MKSSLACLPNSPTELSCYAPFLLCARSDEHVEQHKHQHKWNSPTFQKAAQALAKIMISTNPTMLKNQYIFDAISVLLRLCDAPDNLLQFEALMALTNISSTGDEAKRHLMEKKAPQTFECVSLSFLIFPPSRPPRVLTTMRVYSAVSSLLHPPLPLLPPTPPPPHRYLQCSQHELVRRAATEALCNLCSLEDMAPRYLVRNGEVLKLWVAFATTPLDDDDFDLPTSCAAGPSFISFVCFYLFARLLILSFFFCFLPSVAGGGLAMLTEHSADVRGRRVLATTHAARLRLLLHRRGEHSPPSPLTRSLPPSLPFRRSPAPSRPPHRVGRCARCLCRRSR